MRKERKKEEDRKREREKNNFSLCKATIQQTEVLIHHPKMKK
jgi:hypothetical protein